MVTDGSTITNTRWGTHFYTVYDISTNQFKVYETEDEAGGAGSVHAIADTSVSIPDASAATQIVFYSACSDSLPGATYNQVLENVQVSDRMIIADAAGFVYKVDATYTDDDGSDIVQRHLTPVIDAGTPGKNKRWPGAELTAKGTSLTLSYRTSDFDTSDTGWTDYTQALTSEYVNYEFFVNDTSKKIQWMISDFSGNGMEVSDFVLKEPLVMENR